MNYGLPSYKVNTATLGLFVEYPFFRTSCVNLILDIAIRFHSSSSHKGMFGSGWQFSYISSITANMKEKRVFLKRGSGQVLAFEAIPKADFSNSAFYELNPLVKGRGRLLEYRDCYLFEDLQQGQSFKYAKKADSSTCYLSHVMDNCGNTLQLHYRPDNSIQEITDPFGRSIKFSYDKLSCCTGVLLPDGREASISYNNGQVEKIINFAGVPTIFAYDANSQIEAIIIGKKLKTTRFTYLIQKDRNLVHTVADRNGNMTRYEMISNDPVTVQVTGSLGYSKKYISRNGLTERIIDNDGGEIVSEFMNNLPVSTMDKNGNKQLVEYDERGNLKRRTDGEGNTESFAYDKSGNLSVYTDALGRATSFTYDDRKNLIRKDMPEGQKIIYHYDAGGRLIRVELPDGNIQNYEYDAFSNLIAVRDNLGYSYRALYDDTGYQRLECIDENGNRTKIKPDELDRLKEIEFADGTMKAFEYDCCAGIVTRDQMGNTWFHERDPMSNIIKKVNPMGSMTGYQYDAAGRLVLEIDELGNSKTFDYDMNGYLVKTTNALGATVCKKHDANGNLIEVIDENQKRFSFEFNRNNLLRKVSDPLGKMTVYGYNAANNLSFVITPGQHKISYTYDRNNNIVQKLVDDKPVADLSYNAAGNIVKVSDATGRTSYEYDIRGRMTAAIYEENNQISMTYDPGDQLASIKYPNGLAVQYTYDSMGRIRSVSWGIHEINIMYDAAGRPVSEKRSNDTESLYVYNSCHRTIKIDHCRQGEVFAGMGYRYDEAGNLLEESRCIPLLDAVPEEAGLEHLSMRYNSLNQLVQRNEDLCRYDADGNMTELEGNQPASFRYDAENRLVGKINTHGETQYEYNVFNQLVKITRNGKTTLRYFDLMGRLLFERDELQRLKCYIYCREQLAAVVNADGSIFFYHYDHRGNTTAVTDEMGEQVCTYAYLPYGGIFKKIEKIYDNCFTFLGAYGVIDEKDGFFLTANRCYDSVAGHFIQQDPLGFVDGQNLYSYAGGNPMTRIDPEGTIIWWIPVAIVVGGFIAYKAYDSAKKVGDSGKKYNEKLTKLDKAREIRDQYRKAFVGGKIDESLLWRAEDNYNRALVEASKQAAETAKTGVWEYGTPGGQLGDGIKDTFCSPP